MVLRPKKTVIGKGRVIWGKESIRYWPEMNGETRSENLQAHNPIQVWIISIEPAD